MTTIVVVEGDLHAGSLYGLCPPKIELSDREYLANPYQQWLWERHEELLQRALDVKRKHRGARFVHVLMGDLTQDTVKGKDIGVITANLMDHKAIAVACVKRSRDVLKPAVTVGVRGTPAHVGLDAQYDEEVVRAVLDTQETCTKWHERVDIDGVIFDIKHHPSSKSYVPYLRGGAINRVVARILTDCGNSGVPVPNVVLRAHCHKVQDTGATWRHVRGIQTPCWQLTTAYGHIITDEPTDVGGVIFTIDGGGYEADIVVYDQPREDAREI